MVARDLSNSASTRLSCSILAMIRSMSLLLAVAPVSADLEWWDDDPVDDDIDEEDTTGCEWLLPRL